MDGFGYGNRGYLVVKKLMKTKDSFEKIQNLVLNHESRPVKSHPDSYQKFQNFLVKLENIGHFQVWNVLDTPHIMCTLLLKLPGSAREKWSRNVLTICRRYNRIPDLTDFIHCFSDEMFIVSDPIFLKEALQRCNVLIRNHITEQPKLPHLLQRMIAKYLLKRNQLIASIVVKSIYWIGAMHS